MAEATAESNISYIKLPSAKKQQFMEIFCFQIKRLHKDLG